MLFDTEKCLMDQMIYKDDSPWPTTPDGGGMTLALVHSELDNAQAAHWQGSQDLSSYYPNGSPARANYCYGVNSTLLCRKVTTSSDDAEENIADGVMNLTSGDLDLVDDSGIVFKVGIRFQDISIPKGARISSATLQFAADEVNLDSTSLTIRGQAIDNAPTFTTVTNDISNRTLTATSVIWEPAAWERIGLQGNHQQSIDLSLILQEIIDRPDFAEGNAIALIIEGQGIRTADSFDGSAEFAPELCISYTENECGVHAKVFLEGFYDLASQSMHTTLRDNNLLSLTQPFNTAPWHYNGTENVNSIPDSVTDWILVATRDHEGNILNQAVGFIHQNGDLLGIDGSGGIPLAEAIGKRLSIHPRLHLAVISSGLYSDEQYDFTISPTKALGVEQLKAIDNTYLLHAGDYDANGIINSIDFNNWKIQGAVLNQYLPIDGDGNGIVNNKDYNLWIRNRSKVGESIIRY